MQRISIVVLALLAASGAAMAQDQILNVDRIRNILVLPPDATPGTPQPAFQSPGTLAPSDGMSAQERYEALVAKGVFDNDATSPTLDQDINRSQFANAAALILGLEGNGETESASGGDQLPTSIYQFIAGRPDDETLTGMESPEVMALLVLRILGVDAGDSFDREALEQIMMSLGLQQPGQGQDTANGSLPFQSFQPDQQRQDLIDMVAESRRREQALFEEAVQKATATGLQNHALQGAQEIKPASIWPAWVGALPSYSAAYSEVAPSLLAGYRALYNGDARGTDAEGRPLEGSFTLMFSAGAADSVDMEGELMGLEFTSNLAHASNHFSAELDNGVVDLAVGIPNDYLGGRIEGKFYGASHENVGGTFGLTGDTTSNVSGHFVGVAH